MPIAIEDITPSPRLGGSQKPVHETNGALLSRQPPIVAENQLFCSEESEARIKVNEVKSGPVQCRIDEKAKPLALPAPNDGGLKHVNGTSTPIGELAVKVSATKDQAQAQQPVQAVPPLSESNGPHATADEDEVEDIPPPPLTVEDKIDRILNVLVRYRIDTAAKKIQWLGKDIVVGQLRRAIEQNSVIRLVLPAFPFKSPNKISKVLGALPDKAEEVALAHLHGLCIMITEIHTPGAEVVVVSDGLMYSGLVPMT